MFYTDLLVGSHSFMSWRNSPPEKNSLAQIRIEAGTFLLVGKRATPQQSSKNSDISSSNPITGFYHIRQANVRRGVESIRFDIS